MEEVRLANPKIVYLSSQEEKTTGGGRRLVCGQCIKVAEQYQWICPYDFMIVIYEQNIFSFNEDQIETLIWHELRHIGVKADGNEIAYDIYPHEVEDFNAIIAEKGIDWNMVK